MRVGFKRRMWIRNFLAVIFLAELTLAVPSHAQYASSSIDKKTSLRALGVVEQLPNGTTRLFPVSIYHDGQYYDARFYYAKPVPMSLYDQTEYIALSDGMPVGKFIVHTAQQIPDGAVWWGIGDWKPNSTSDDSSKKAETKAGDKDDGRPILKRAPGADGKSPDDKKSGARTEASDNGGFKPDNDTDRPILRKPKEGAKPQEQITEATGEKSHIDPSENDPDRPILVRKQPVQNDEPVALVAPKRGEKGAKYLVAISDAAAMNNRPYDYDMAPSEKQKWAAQLTRMGMDALRKYAQTQANTPLPTNAKFAETHIKAFDLDYSNAPYMIFTGRVEPTVEAPQLSRNKKVAQEALPRAQLSTFYVTVVARLNSQDQLNQLMALPTDSLHLDLTPRLDLIDAVDANGDNRAELLFRKTTDSGASYVLYQMTPFQMTKVFEGGSGN
ncbi:MAG: hypothetical protein ROO76_02005 [Terriglobia bacterium]|nr:hypothetical protein [Terriglobia bacterium]